MNATRLADLLRSTVELVECATYQVGRRGDAGVPIAKQLLSEATAVLAEAQSEFSMSA